MGLVTAFTVGVTLGAGGMSSRLAFGEGFGVGASPRFELRLLFEPITVAGVDCCSALLFVLVFAFARRGVGEDKGWMFLSLSPVGVPTDCTG